MLGSSHFYIMLIDQTQGGMHVITHYVGFFPFLHDEMNVQRLEKAVITHYVGFFSFLHPDKFFALPNDIVLLPTTLGSFHFYGTPQKLSKIKGFQRCFCKYLSEYSENQVFTTFF